MAELTAKSPCAGLLPITRGRLTLEEVRPGEIWSLAPYSGQHGALAEIVTQDHGVGWPGSGFSVSNEDLRLMWFGRDDYMMIGAQPSERIRDFVAVTDQGDGWAVVRLSGDGVEAVLARLVPVDLRGKTFGVDQCCRTMLGHMNVSLLRVSENTFEIMAFRSMAQTLVQELAHVMAQVSARSGK